MTDGTQNFQNRTLYHLDNLDVLRGMNSGSVHLIATDPPFNKNRDFHATPDSLAKGAKFQDRWRWKDDVHDDWLTLIMRDYPEVWAVITNAREVWGSDMAAFLAFMGVRLIEMRRVLHDDGSIYLHCDPTASHYLKMLMDAIFGRKNFLNEIVWYYKTGGTSKNYFSRKHDLILFYSKTDQYAFNHQKEKSYLAHRYGFKNVEIFEDEQGPYTKVGMRDVWDIAALRGNQPENTGYPTQKPLALYERIIRASSNEGDMVLDPFAGCATTPIAAERLGRKWIGIDLWQGAYEQVLDRLQKEGLAVPDAQRAQQPNLLTFGDVQYLTMPPKRTDYEDPTPYLETPTTRRQRRFPPPRQQHCKLLTDIGAYCQGCGNSYAFDPRVLEVDHRQPKSDGGSDAYTNLTLLCPPCNKLKRDRLTLFGLQDENRKAGHLKPENENNLKHVRPNIRRRSGRRR